MSNYNSTNTIVLATHEAAGGNTRMLLLHVCESGRHEYVIGSYFKQETIELEEMDYETGFHELATAYSWDWGHYFSDGFSEDCNGLLSAVDYWKREVLGTE